MSDITSDKKIRAALLASIGVNIFLVAFSLGRVAPPPPFGGPGMNPAGIHQSFGPQGGFEGERGDRGDFKGQDHKEGREGRAEHRGFGHPVPPTFVPGDVFTPDELRADEARMRESFDKMRDLRNAFVGQLQAGAVTKEQVLKHFAEIDQVMADVRKEAQGRVAVKISSMPETERKHLAESLQRRHEEGDGPRGEVPRELEPQSQREPARDSIKR